jgi:Tfp pilus assembly ATPase PilU
MMTLNQSLVQLVKSGLVEEAAALPHAPNVEEYRLNMQGMYTGIDSIDLRTEGDKWKKDKDKP